VTQRAAHHIRGQLGHDATGDRPTLALRLNSDSIAHTATDPGVFDTGSIAPTSAADVPVPFKTSGTYNYHCTLHANESATIVVTQ